MSIRKRLILVAALLFILIIVRPQYTAAQCSMCATAAENAVTSENKKGLGLNNGILLLLSMPYAAALIIGILWYRNSKYKKAKKIITD